MIFDGHLQLSGAWHEEGGLAVQDGGGSRISISGSLQDFQIVWSATVAISSY